MKSSYNILATILGVYFATFPIVFALHVLSHSSGYIQTIELLYVMDEVSENPFCYICDFYVDQQLYFEGSTINYFLDTFYYGNEVLSPFLQTITILQLHLRGPPFMSLF